MKKAIAIIVSIMLVLAITLPAAAISSIAVKSIKLNNSKITLKIGQTSNLKVTLTPTNTSQKKLTYVTSNKKIATVSTAGKITGISKGTTTITVYTLNKKIFAKCNVTVSQFEDYGDTGGTTLPISKEPITLKAMLWTYPDTPQPENWLTKELKKRTNIKLLIERYPADDPAEKLGTLVAANDLPDIIGQLWSTNMIKLGMENFAPINKNLDSMPNYKKIMDAKPTLMKSFSHTDGNLYYFVYPAYLMGPTINYGMIVRKDILEKNGINPALSGPDEYYNAMKKLKEVYPNSTPFINYYEGDILERLSQSWNTYIKMFVPDGGDKYVYGPVTKEYKDMLDYLAKLYREGLMDPEFMTSGEEKFSAKVLQADQGFIYWAWFGRADTLTNTAKATIPDYKMAVSLPMGPYKKNMKESEFLDYGLAVSSNSKHLKEAIKLVDYFYSPSGAELISMGKKGETYNVGTNGKITYPAFPGQNVTRVELEKKYGICLSNLMQVADPRSSILTLTDTFKNALAILKDSVQTAPQPQLKFTDAENKEKLPIEDALLKAMKEFSAQVIQGKASTSSWDTWVKKNEQYGYKKVEEIYNAAYERLMK